MTFETWLAFAVASNLLLIIPGPTILTVVSYSIAHGPKANIPLVCAVALGDATAILLSVVGLGAVLATSAWAFTIVKWIGGAYLLFLGIQMILSGVGKTQSVQTRTPDSTRKLVFNTWLVTALNPKGIVFFIAFLPQFINPLQNAVPQLWILSITFVALATLNASLYALFANSARRFLDSPSSRKLFNFVGGGLLCAAGGWALSSKPS